MGIPNHQKQAILELIATVITGRSDAEWNCEQGPETCSLVCTAQGGEPREQRLRIRSANAENDSADSLEVRLIGCNICNQAMLRLAEELYRQFQVLTEDPGAAQGARKHRSPRTPKHRSRKHKPDKPLALAISRRDILWVLSYLGERPDHQRFLLLRRKLARYLRRCSG